MDYLVAIAAFILYWLLGRKLGKWKDKVWYLRPALLVIGTASLAATGLGSLLADWMGALFNWVTGLFGIGEGAAVVAGFLALIMAIGCFLDLKDKKADGFAKAALIMLPLLVMVAAGPIADAGGELFDGINNGARNATTNVVGGG